MHFDSAQRKQKGFTPIFLLIGIVIICTVVGTSFYFSKSASTKPSPTPYIPSSTKTTLSSTPQPEIVEIPLPKTWIKYKPNCKSLADNIEIFYPDNWLPKEYGNISDTLVPDADECQIMFGYPVEPQGYQAPTPGQLAWFKVQSFIDKNESLAERVEEMSNQSPKAKSVTNITLNGLTWSKVDYDIYASRAITKVGNRFIEIYLINNLTYTGENLDNLVNLTNTDVLNDEILNKIKLLHP